MSARKPPRPTVPPSRPVKPRPAGDRPTRPAGDRPTRPADDRPTRPADDRPTRPAVPNQRTAPLRLPVAPPPEVRPPRLRLAVILAAVAALVLAAVLVVFDVRGGDEGEPGARGPGRVPAVPVDLAKRSAVVQARITGSGEVAVRQWIRSAATLFGIHLSPPPAAAGSSPVRVRDVQVFANGAPALGAERLEKDREYYPFRSGTNDVFVSYRLVGAVERSGSVAGRALATVTALEVDVNPPLVASTYAVSGGDVLNLACAAPVDGAVPVPCGEPIDSGWQVRLDKASLNDVVTAQLDLP